jgi:signal transduction histidine kinase
MHRPPPQRPVTARPGHGHPRANDLVHVHASRVSALDGTCTRPVHTSCARRGATSLTLADIASECACSRLACELATNAICHGEGAARIGVSHADGHLRVEVHDDGAGRPVRRQPDTDDESGRGLALIDGLIELQGGERGMAEDGRGPGKTVYVVIRLPADGSDTRQ